MITKKMAGLLISTLMVAALPAFAEGTLPGVSGTTSLGASLVDNNGMTLYTSSADIDGKSMCTGDCAASWLPLEVAADAQASGDWTITTREDGTRMWAFKGHPVYTSAADKAAGDVMGDIKNGFSIANNLVVTAAAGANADTSAAMGALMLGTTVKGTAWVDANGMTLYTYEKDGDGKSMCNDECAVEWPPLAASADAKASGDLTIVVRDDGSKMWALFGRPLYTFVDDKSAGEVNGDNVDGFHLAM